LSRTGYHLYYHLREENQSVQILALWHARRESGPKTLKD
jgi:plasmid stabilization system protein ParE